RNRKNALRRTIVGIIDGWEKVRAGRETDGLFASGSAREARVRAALADTDAWLAFTNDSIARLDKVKDVAAGHSPRRWEANRALMWAQLHKNRFQLGQYKLALDDLAALHNIMPPGNMGWEISATQRPTLRGPAAEVEKERKEVEALFREIIEKHPRTPWALYAESEMKTLNGFGIGPWFVPETGIPHPR
ncbi:MAG TPA: hypothetical protein VMX57_08440, partial [Planctomycetota bacterium]|nr:hypothetical protein [Planctomycetota bacterium]